MSDFASLNSLCLGNEQCLQWLNMLMSSSSVRETASTALGIISVIVWMVADIPQIITNCRQKSTEGLSVAFLLTWIIGDLFNFFGCLLEPATVPTQLFTAVLFTIITASLCSQTIYYERIYPRLKYNRQIKINTSTNAEQSKSEIEKGNDADQSNKFDEFKTGIGLSSPIPFPEHTHNNFVGRPLFYHVDDLLCGSLKEISLTMLIKHIVDEFLDAYKGSYNFFEFTRSARYLSKSHTPVDSILGQRLESSSHTVNPIEEHLLGSTIHTQSAPVLKTKTTLCVVSTLTFLSVFNLLQSPDTTIHPMSSKPRQEFVVYVGRKLFQDSGNLLSEDGGAGHSSIGTLLGWAMAVLYMSGRLPQIRLNIRRGTCEGINPFMFLFAVTGNVTYVASILVRSLDWSKIGPNLPWLIEPGVCALLDCFILMQYFRYRTSKCQESKYKHQYVA